MRKLNRPAEDGDRSEVLRRLKEARAVRDGRRVHSRPIGESRIRRVHAVLHGALTDAVKLSKIRPDNPADGVWRTKGGKRKQGRAKPLLWTDERVEAWQKNGVVPAKVMVWTSEQAGNFLDFAEATEERMYPAFHLDAYYGPRRGELVGAEEKDLSQAQSDDELDDTKTEAGYRQVPLDDETVRVLKAWSKTKARERLSWGETYQDAGRVFCYEDGTALKAEYLSSRFRILLERHANIRERALGDGWSVERGSTGRPRPPSRWRCGCRCPRSACTTCGTARPRCCSPLEWTTSSSPRCWGTRRTASPRTCTPSWRRRWRPTPRAASRPSSRARSALRPLVPAACQQGVENGLRDDSGSPHHVARTP
jgi:integrase